MGEKGLKLVLPTTTKQRHGHCSATKGQTDTLDLFMVRYI